MIRYSFISLSASPKSDGLTEKHSAADLDDVYQYAINQLATDDNRQNYHHPDDPESYYKVIMIILPEQVFLKDIWQDPENISRQSCKK